MYTSIFHTPYHISIQTYTRCRAHELFDDRTTRDVLLVFMRSSHKNNTAILNIYDWVGLIYIEVVQFIRIYTQKPIV